MTIDLGAQTAKTIADNHEAGSDGPANENAMDLANNSYGRSVGANAAGATNDEKFDAANAACQAAAASGALVTLE